VSSFGGALGQTQAGIRDDQPQVVSSFFRTLILAERQLDRAQAVVLLI
jgi:hypothetical protein